MRSGIYSRFYHGIFSWRGNIPMVTMVWVQYAVFWVIPRRLSFKGRRFGTKYQFHFENGTYLVPKRRPLKLRRRGITQKTAHYITKFHFFLIQRCKCNRINYEMTLSGCVNYLRQVL